MFERNICQFVPTRRTELDLEVLHFVLETKQVEEKNSILSVYRVYYVIEGEGYFKTSYEERKVQKGSVMFCFPGKEFSLTSTPGFKYAYISYIGLRAAALTDRHKLGYRNSVFDNVNELMSIWKNALPVPPSVVDLRAEAVLLYTYSAVGSIISKEAIPDLETNGATEAKKYMDAHFSDPTLSLSSICKALSYSPKYLSSVFTKQYKISLSKYLNSIRIEHACSLLEKGHTSIKTIAYMCGFNDPLYFSKVFKALKKCAPREYIAKLKENNK
ncbi:MAG: helix-turn-helix transcriptional regulator [Clostridia bacterium]|nr:helix-turn-helix transcriptional regulator [Clostridia bacterium]